MTDTNSNAGSGNHGSLFWLVIGLGGGLIIVLVIFGSLWSLLQIGGRPVDSQVETYFARFNAGDFASIYADAHPTLAQATKQTDFLAQGQLFSERFGPFESKSIRGITQSADRSGILTNASYDAKFANGYATFEFYFMGNGEDRKLSSVEVRSSLLPEDSRGRRRR